MSVQRHTSPETEGVIKDPRLKSLRGFVLAGLKRHRVPGAIVGVVENGKIIHIEPFGLRDARRGLPVTPRTRFAIASCTKSFTAASLALLVADGRLDWDKPVCHYMPDFRLWDSFAGSRITARDLLTHRTGLPAHSYFWMNSPLSREEMLARLCHLEPSKDLRSAYQYNNLAYMLAGLLAQRITGRPWEDLVRERLLGPCGMTASRFWHEPPPADDELATGYIARGKGRVECAYRPGSGEGMSAVGPAGNIVAPVTDVLAWLNVHLHDGKAGGKQVIPQKQLAELHRPTMCFDGGNGGPEFLPPAYALGWAVQPYRGQLFIEHGGLFGGYNSLMSFMPGRGLGVMVMLNMLSPLNRLISFRVYDLLLGARPFYRPPKVKPPTKKPLRRAPARPSHKLADYAGRYVHPGYGALEVRPERGGLVLLYNGLRYRLKHFHYDVFRLVQPAGVELGPEVMGTFHTGHDGLLQSVSIPFEPAVRPIVFERAMPVAGHQ